MRFFAKYFVFLCVGFFPRGNMESWNWYAIGWIVVTALSFAMHDIAIEREVSIR